MTAHSTWHAPTPVLEQFAQHPQSLDAPSAASVETHLVSCANCRAVVAQAAPTDTASKSWALLAEKIDQPGTSLFERILLRVGVSNGAARLAAATPGLRLSGVASMGILTGIAVAVARSSGADGPFLLLAPLVPLVAVALTFVPAADPGGEIGVATAVHGTGLAIRRAAAVLTLSFVLLGLGALALPAVGPELALWVLPATALAATALALGTWIRVEGALVGLGLVWVVSVGLARRAIEETRPLSSSALFTSTGQLVALAITITAVAIVAARSDRFTTLEVRG